MEPDLKSENKALKAALFFALKMLNEVRTVDPERIDPVLRFTEVSLPEADRPAKGGDGDVFWLHHGEGSRHAFTSPHDARALCQRSIKMPRATNGLAPLCDDCAKRTFGKK